MSYLYRGRHRAPAPRGHGAAQAAVVGAVALAPVAVALPAQADVLDAIAACESSGDPTVVGPTTAAGPHLGLFQFDMPTWRSVGGTGSPIDASPAEQRRRAEILLARRGTQPWLASQDCWSKRGGVAVAAGAPAPARKATPAPRAPQRRAQAASSGSVTVRAGDTLGSIAAAHETDWRSLWQANRATVADPDLIFPGERLTLA